MDGHSDLVARRHHLHSLAEAAEIVYAHQERFDGSGYPRCSSLEKKRGQPDSLSEIDFYERRINYLRRWCAP